VVIVIFFALAYSHILYGYSLVAIPGGSVCTVPNVDYLMFLINVFTKIDVFLFSVIPFFLLVISNTILILKLRESVSGEQFATGSEVQQASRRKRVNSVTVTAIAVSVAFIVLSSPIAFLNMTTLVLNPSGSSASSSLNRFLNAFFFALAYFNYTVNFYLYVLTGARFRKEFRILSPSFNSHETGL